MVMIKNYSCLVGFFSFFALGWMFPATAAATNFVPQILDLTYKPSSFNRDSGIQVLPLLLNGDDVNNVIYRCRWFVNAEEVVNQTGDFLEGDLFSRGDLVAVEVTPSWKGQQGKPVRSGEVEAGNAPPQIISQPPEEFSPGLFSYEIEAVDADGDFLTYELLDAPHGMHLGSESGHLIWEIEEWEIGLVNVTVLVDDGFGGKDKQQFTMDLSFMEKGLDNE